MPFEPSVEEADAASLASCYRSVSLLLAHRLTQGRCIDGSANHGMPIPHENSQSLAIDQFGVAIGDLDGVETHPPTGVTGDRFEARLRLFPKGFN
jgi:hypothetical protein